MKLRLLLLILFCGLSALFFAFGPRGPLKPHRYLYVAMPGIRTISAMAVTASERKFDSGCHRMAISPDGLTMYLPSLENTFWNVVDCKSGKLVYLDDIGSPWL